jgi:hypothetical protein
MDPAFARIIFVYLIPVVIMVTRNNYLPKQGILFVLIGLAWMVVAAIVLRIKRRLGPIMQGC